MIINQRISQAAERTTWALTSTPVLGPLLVLLYGVTVAACLVIVIIILTRPKPAYGRQGLAGSWGQDTDEVSAFLVFLKGSSTKKFSIA